MSLPLVLCAGRVYCDLVFSGLSNMPVSGNETYADGLSMHTGGGAAITAFYLAQLDRPVELCASLPASPFSQQVYDDLDDGVGLQFSAVRPNEEPQITVVLTGAMDRSFITRRVGQALPDNYLKTLSSAEYSSQPIRHLHIGELATLLEHPDLLVYARSQNWSVSLDCAWDIDALGSSHAKDLIESVDVFMPNESEIARLDDIGVSVESAPLTVVKTGAAGAIAYSTTGTVESHAETTTCIDATGAGDAFDAGFIHAWLQDKPIEECLATGNRCGAKAVARIGGIG